MVKYIIEGGINFYEELYKSLDDDKSDDKDDDKDKINNICQITGLPLDNKYVKLECSHKFNYGPLYNEICKQKYVFKTYNYSSLDTNNFTKFREAKTDYYIKCPYCRNIQFTLLPYYPDEKYEPRYGINTLEKTNISDDLYLIKIPNSYYSKDHKTFMCYGYMFKKGPLCGAIINKHNDKPVYCKSDYTSLVPEINKSFCMSHIKDAVRQYKKEKKEEEKQKKLLEKEQQKIQKENDKKEKALQKQIEKEGKISKKKSSVNNVVNNVVSNTITIGEFNESESIQINPLLCPVILKSGSKKGQICGSNIKVDGTCLRHSVYKKQKIILDFNESENNIL